MDPVIGGVVGTVVLLILLACGVHVGIALFAVALGGMMMLGVGNVFEFLGASIFTFSWAYVYICLPLFIFMGVLASRAGIAKALYEVLYKWVQKLPGSLAIATTLGCAAFGAVSGSSIATSAIFGRVSLPEMTKYKYAKSLSLGCVAAAGTFACMIPPSTLFILYSVFTETSIGQLFAAGIVPGLITAIIYSLSIFIRVKKNPALAPVLDEARFSWRDRIISLKDVLPIAILAIVVLGGIFFGIFTVTEGAAVGCVGTIIIGIWKQGFRKMDIPSSLTDTAHTTAMLFLIIIGALFFARFIALSQIPNHLSEYLTSLVVPREVIIVGIFAMYFLLGMVIVPSGIMAITLPAIFPIVLSLGYNPVWFGVIIMKASEIAAVTPPVGLNVYVIKGVVGREATLEEIFAGIWPFVVCDVIVFGFLVAFPQICLWLPNMMLGN